MEKNGQVKRPELATQIEILQAQLEAAQHQIRELSYTPKQLDRLHQLISELSTQLATFSDSIPISPPRRMTKADLLPRTTEEQWRSLSACLPVGIFTCDVQGNCTYVNPRCEEIVSGTLDDCLGEGWINLIHPDDRDRVIPRWLINAKAGRPHTDEFRVCTSQGEIRWVYVRTAPIWSERGEFIGHTGTVEDITKQRQAEVQVRASLREKEALLKEIHHRVKNNLQIISSLIYLQAQRIEDPTARQIFEDSQSRISSMALVHDSLYRSQDFARIDLSEYVQTLTGRLFQTYRIQPDVVKLQVRVEAGVIVSLDKAIPCGLILNELMTNALKHGFPHGQTGAVTVILERSGEQVCLMVENDGTSLPESFELQEMRTMGLRLVNALVNQLHGQFEFEKTVKTRFKVTFRG